MEEAFFLCPSIHINWIILKSRNYTKLSSTISLKTATTQSDHSAHKRGKNWNLPQSKKFGLNWLSAIFLKLTERSKSITLTCLTQLKNWQQQPKRSSEEKPSNPNVS
jgi:hypothetical protein